MLDDFMRKTRGFIENGQISIIQVGAGFNKPNFAYTIGLQDLASRPEIIVMALPIKVSQIILNDIADDVLNDFDYSLNKEYTHLTQNGYPFLLRNVNSSHLADWFGYGLRHRECFPIGTSFAAQQLFYTDKLKCFPWDRGYSMPRETQIRLDL